MISILKRIWRFLVDAFEIYLSALSFLIMFLAFILQIFTRYVMGYQVEWTYEATVIGFMWVVAFGASYASRLREHVSFSMLYDRLSVRSRALVEILTNLFLLTAFVIMFRPVIDFIDFMKIKKTAVMKVPLSVLYAPFVFFLLSSTVYIIRDTLSAVKVLRKTRVKKDVGP